jgi:hypothetical protein
MQTNRRVIRRNPSAIQSVTEIVPVAAEIVPDIQAAEAPIVSEPAETVPAETSSNRYQKSTVPVRKDLIRFTNGDKKATNRKRRASLTKGGMLFGPRDLVILQTTTAWGWLSRRNLALLLQTKPRNLERRLAQLVRFGLLSDRSRGFGNETLFAPTKLGLKHAGMTEFKVSRASAQTITHSDALIFVALRFQESSNGETVFVTERELAAAASGNLSARIQAIAPWAQDQFAGQFKNWTLDAGTIAGKESGGVKRPDGLLLTKTNPLAQAVEMEITIKTLESYRRILSAYDNAILKGHLQPVVYYVTGAITGQSEAIKTTITHSLAILSETRKPVVKIQHAVLSEAFWHPAAARNGWFPPVK